MVIHPLSYDEEFYSASSRFEAGICSCDGYLHPELLQLLTSLLTERQICGLGALILFRSQNRTLHPNYFLFGSLTSRQAVVK